MPSYTYVIEPYGFQRSVHAPDQRSAHRKVWEGLTDAQRDGCECLDCVDIAPDGDTTPDPRLLLADSIRAGIRDALRLLPE